MVKHKCNLRIKTVKVPYKQWFELNEKANGPMVNGITLGDAYLNQRQVIKRQDDQLTALANEVCRLERLLEIEKNKTWIDKLFK